MKTWKATAAVLMVGLLLAWPPFFEARSQAAVRELSDQGILEAVEQALLKDPGVVLNDINVSVNQGVVALSGAVDNILARNRAARVAETVKGVRSVVNRIDVEPPVLRSDMDIARDVEDALLVDPATESFEIRAAVSDGMVTLRGTVGSWQEKHLAGRVAKGVRGVTGLENDIEVVAQDKRSPYEIRAEVRQTLRWDALVDHALIEVAVEDGRVELSGVVGSAAEKRRAFLDAHVSGVRNVDASGLEVKYWAREERLREDKYVVVSDEAVRRAVEDALLYDPRVISVNVTSRVEDGVVTLRGVVDDLREKRAAGQDAENTVGVVRVKNRLRVRPEDAASDRDLRNRVRGAVERDPYLDAPEISVDVTGGTAVLQGSVDSYFEKSRADEVASRVDGIHTVKNKLTVDYALEYLPQDPYVDRGALSGLNGYRPEPRHPKREDARIEAEIRDELWWSPFVNEEDVAVKVSEGRATLTGTVSSWSQYDAAARNAYEGGAVWVDNDLVVNPG